MLELGFGDRKWYDCLAVVDNTSILGFAAFTFRFELLTRERTLWISDFAVAKAYHRRGIGRTLFEAVRGVAKRQDCNAIALEVWARNHAARMLYDDLGAQHVCDIDLLRSLPN